MKIRLTSKQVKYLKFLESKSGLPASLEVGDRAVQGPVAALDELREVLTVDLANREFKGEYSTNEEDQMIEDMIDLLFRP